MMQPNLFGVPQTELTSDDWYTPKWIFDAIGITFDLDVACPPEGPINVPATRWYTKADDGLAQPWEGRVWMNPPYSKPDPWVTRFIEHGNGCALMVMTKAHWFERLWLHPDTFVIYFRGIKFVRPDVPNGAASSWSYGLWAIGNEPVEALHNSKLGRVR